MKILVTDDDPTLLLLMTNVLERAGHDVLEASTGEQSLEMARAHRPDLVLLDVMLPDISGLDVLKEIKADPDLRRTFVILLSGMQTSSDYQAAGLDYGADGYLAKPIPNKELLARVKAMERITRAEEALRESERRYREFVDFLPQTVVEFDEKGKFLFVNTNGLETFGYTTKDLEAGLTVMQMIAREDRGRAGEDIRGAMQGQISAGREYTMVRKDGSTFPALIHSNPIIRKGRIAGLRSIVIDITARKEMEETLKESEERYRTAIESSTDGVVILRNDLYTYVNRAFLDMFGYSDAHEVVGRHRSGTLHPNDRERVIGYSHARLQGEQAPRRYEFQGIRKDGTTLHVEVSAAPISYQGEPVILAYLRDVTERKHAEDTLKASLREKEVLLKEIHHRVKNNLQVMSSLLNLQSRYLTDQKAVDIFRESMDRVKTMALIHDKLYRSEDLSRIYFPAYVSDLVHDLVSAYAPGKGIELRIDVDPISFDVDTAIPLGLIINELVSNAVKHGFPGEIGGTVGIGLSAEGSRLTLTVSDNGTGFPENLDFMNAPSMGMQLVVTLVEQIDGDVELKRGKGTEFRIIFQVEG